MRRRIGTHPAPAHSRIAPSTSGGSVENTLSSVTPGLTAFAVIPRPANS